MQISPERARKLWRATVQPDGTLRAQVTDTEAGQRLAKAEERENPYSREAMRILRDTHAIAPSTSRTPSADWLRARPELANDYLDGVITFSEIVRKSGWPDSSLRRAWARVYGMSPSAWKKAGGPAPKDGDT